jgi:MFS family permease
MLGAGFLTSLISMRMQESGAGSFVIGALGTSYFVGLTLGAIRAGRLVQRVGHIRAFAAFVSLLSASTLGYAVLETPYLWILLRLVDGGCIAGVYVCLESWLNDRAEAKARGGVLAAYMIALYSGQGLGQQLLNASHTSPAMPFIIASILVSLAVLPITLTRMTGPVLAAGRSLGIRRLYAVSPLGIVGAAGTGVMLGGFYALGAVYALQSGLPVAMTAWFMSAVILGGVALQWPLGQLSDRFDRRKVIVATAAGAALAALALALWGPAGWGLLLAALFGGTSFALYPLCVAHTNDHLAADERIAATGGLVLIYSLGAACGPLLAAGAMSVFGSDGLFLSIGLLAVALFAFGLWRQWAREPVPEDRQQAYQVLPRTTPTAASLDPLASPPPDAETEELQSRGRS